MQPRRARADVDSHRTRTNRSSDHANPDEYARRRAAYLDAGPGTIDDGYLGPDALDVEFSRAEPDLRSEFID